MRKIFLIVISLSLLSITTACASTDSELTDKQIVSIMGSCVEKNQDRINAGENLFDTGYMDVTMAILSDCVESKNSQLQCGSNDDDLTVCGIKGRRTGFSFF